jgi:hypothetical protein
MATKATKKEAEPIYARPLLKSKTLRQIVHRVGALKVLEMPSRMANTLYYPDGRVVKDKQ